MRDEDRLTLERFRRRMAAIEPLLPDPPLPGPSAAAQRRRPAAAQRRGNESPGRQVYLLLAIALAVLAAVASPYLARQARAPDVPPAGTALPAVAQSAPPTVAPTVAPAVAPTVALETAGRCALSPILFDAGQRLPVEQWAGHDWALIEGRLQVVGGGRLAVQVTRGPFAGPVREVSWPAGYRVITEGGQLVLRDPSDGLLGRPGEPIMVSGSLQPDGTLSACHARPLTSDPAR